MQPILFTTGWRLGHLLLVPTTNNVGLIVQAKIIKWASYRSFFTAQRYASAVYAVIVCPFVTSRSSTKMATWLNLGSHKQCPGTRLIWCQKSRRNSNITPTVAPNRGAVGRFKSVLFDQYLIISQKWCKIRTQLLWKASRNSYAFYRMTLFSMTLGDPNYPKRPKFRHFVSSFKSL